MHFHVITTIISNILNCFLQSGLEFLSSIEVVNNASQSYRQFYIELKLDSVADSMGAIERDNN